jgi:hypothetical protein
METLTITKPSVKVHSMFRGDAERAQKQLIKKNILGSVQNNDKPIRFEILPISDLLPLDTQRDTKETWVKSRLKDLNGFDMLAAGALQVALDPNDKKYYVFDGCGRLAQAQVNCAPSVLPCLVYDITKEQAAFYFAYNQDKGRRNLSKEVIFVNAYYSGEKDAVQWADRLAQINCFIKGVTDYAVPHPQKSGHPEIKYRALTEGWKMSGGNIGLMKQVRDMICLAWGSTNSGVDIIRQDLFLGLITFLQVYPEAQKNGLNKSLQSFLNATAALTTQGKLDWKHTGLNKHNQEAMSVAYGLTKAFRSSQFFKPQFGNVITLKKFDEFDPAILSVEEDE